MLSTRPPPSPAFLSAAFAGRSIQIPDERIDIDTVGHGSLFNVLETRDGASDAMKPVFHENPDGIRVFLDHLLNGHILGNRHVLTSFVRRCL
jgi:hypothetical protein